MCGIWLPDCSRLPINRINDNGTTIYWHDISVCVFFVCFLSNLVTGPSFICRVMKFPFIRDWPEIQKLKIPLSEFYLIRGNWTKSGIPIWHKTAFTLSELVRENQLGVNYPLSTQISINKFWKSLSDYRIKIDLRGVFEFRMLP